MEVGENVCLGGLCCCLLFVCFCLLCGFEEEMVIVCEVCFV